MDESGATWHVNVVDETGSTNADLLAAALAGAPDRSVLAARHQTAGRGRLDRAWVAPPGANLLVSMLFRTVPAHPHELTQRVALAARDAAERVAGVHAGLKWPNDLLVDGAKLAGVLAQAGVVEGRLEHVVVGIGLNVGWAPDGGARLGEGIDPLVVLDALLVAFDALPADVHERYRASLVTLGQRVRVERGSFMSPDQAEGVACLTGSPRAPRVGELRGDELVVIEGQLGDGPWARALLDAAWTVYDAPKFPRTCVFAYLADGVRAVDTRFLEGERGAEMRRDVEQALSAARKVAAAGAGIVQNGPNDYTMQVKDGTFARVGVDARAVHTWSLRSPTTEALARLATYFRAIGGGGASPAPANATAPALRR